MKNMPRLAAILALLAFLAASASAEPLEKLARKLETGLKGQTVKQMAVLSFPYHDGTMSSGSTIVQERLTTFLVEGGKVQVVERSLLKKALEEMKLETSGLMDPQTTKELGKVLGVDAVLIGTLNDLSKKKTEINARIIQTETGKILTAGQASFSRTWTDEPRQISGGTTLPPVTGPVTPTTPANPPTGQYLGKALVQLAILLDTSNSMDGLISQAKNQLWHIVNEFGAAEKGGNNPTVQVALYEYGNDNLSAGEGYIRQVLPFTTDLDKVSEQLFALKTRGGQEYCGWVIRDAVNGLQWDPHADVYKAIFDAGNEPFTQGPVDFHESVAAAAKKGITVNTIFCGPRQEGVAMQWQAGAEAGGGDYANIDQGAQVVSVQAPQDAEIQRLSGQLNDTFIAYGSAGKKAQKRQEAMDNAAAAAPAAAGVATQRALAKGSAQYSQSAQDWDAVSAMESGKLTAGELRKEELPSEMQAMDAKERAAYIKRKAAERKDIQAKINRLNEERRKYVSAEEKKLAAQGASQTLGQAVIKTVRTQAAKKGFKFK
ncbi:MAG: FlgO family outer membrane protein [Elusimicrobia bacterium]|nr:FlgO family outer membrane protein [Elusimicrobiota bacterium]